MSLLRLQPSWPDPVVYPSPCRILLSPSKMDAPLVCCNDVNGDRFWISSALDRSTGLFRNILYIGQTFVSLLGLSSSPKGDFAREEKHLLLLCSLSCSRHAPSSPMTTFYFLGWQPGSNRRSFCFCPHDESFASFSGAMASPFLASFWRRSDCTAEFGEYSEMGQPRFIVPDGNYRLKLNPDNRLLLLV